MNKVLKRSASALAVLYGINKYIESTVKRNTTKSSGNIYQWEHGNIFYRVSGEGKPVLLIHDLNVYSSENEWTLLAEMLSRTNKVYTIDLLGCGRSDKPALTYTNYLYVQLITDFIKKVIKEKTIVAGSGLSGTFVLKADAMDKELMETIFLINPPSLPSLRIIPDKYSKRFIYLFQIPVIGTACYYFATSKSNTEYYLSENCYFNPFNLPQSVIKAYYQAAHLRNGNGKYLLASLKGNYLNINLANTLKNAGTKIILISGEGEPNHSEIAANYQKINQNLIVKTIKETKKLPHLEAPDRVYEIINEYK